MFCPNGERHSLTLSWDELLQVSSCGGSGSAFLENIGSLPPVSLVALLLFSSLVMIVAPEKGIMLSSYELALLSSLRRTFDLASLESRCLR